MTNSAPEQAQREPVGLAPAGRPKKIGSREDPISAPITSPGEKAQLAPNPNANRRPDVENCRGLARAYAEALASEPISGLAQQEASRWI